MAEYDVKQLNISKDGDTYHINLDTGASGTITVSGTITNVSGSYSQTFNDARITSGMKCVELELGTTSIFNGDVSVSSGDGTVTIACDDVAGSSTFVATFIASILNSTEYDALDTAKADKVPSATEGNFVALDESGNLTDSGHKHSDYLTEHQTVTDSSPTLAWGQTSSVATIGDTTLHVTMPDNPNVLLAYFDATDNSIVFRSPEAASYNASDMSIAINI